MRQFIHPARWLIFVALIGCAPTVPTGPASPGRGIGEVSSGVPKTITLAQLNPVVGYGYHGLTDTGGGGASLAAVHTVGLAHQDAKGNLEGRLATKLPSFDDGSMVVLPDGRLRTTWNLRPNVKWHDGQPFTAEDLVFSLEVARLPELAARTAAILNADTLEAVDPLTLVITWKSTFYRALEMSHREFWPFARHVLAEPFQGDKAVFLAHPYWTTDYVSVGPFRLVDFGFGEHQVFERFDDYFLGRPKVNTIIIRTIGDPNTLLVNLKSGAIDIAAEKALPLTAFVQLQEEWKQTGGGVLVTRQDNWRYIRLQMGLDWAQPPEMAQDVRIRRGLLNAIDRDVLREFVLPGFADSSGDTFMQASDPRGQIVGQPFARYRYDPARAAQEMGEAGWRRGTDGRLANREGRPVHIELRGSNQTDAPEVSVIADYWRALGLEVSEVTPSPALTRNREYTATFPGGVVTARSSGDEIFPVFDSRQHPDPRRDWVGVNEGHYVNPRLDPLIDRLYATLGERDQALLLREMGDMLAADLPILPIYYRTTFAAVRSGVRALEDFSNGRGTATGPGIPSRNAHLWDRD